MNPVTPNAPSAPVWTLQQPEQDIDTTPSDTPPQDNKPVKKGWWQRTFSGGD